VIAIIITIVVLEMKVPHGDRWKELLPVAPTFLSYVLSFVYVGIYWNNHHHMLHACTTVTRTMLWANLHLLFWPSLFPFATGWKGENHFTTAPTALYGLVLLMAAIAYYVLQQTIIRAQGNDSILKKAVGRDWKGKLVLYLVAVVATFRSTSVAQGIFVAVHCYGDPRSAHQACAAATSRLVDQIHRSCHKSIGDSVLAITRDRWLRNSSVKSEGDDHENSSNRRNWTHRIKARQQAS
jgi:uncharacterized membrane protein